MIIYSSKPDSVREYCNKIWANRWLILTLAKRDLKVRYAQTFLGISWTILQPLTSVAIYSIFFFLLLKFETKYPYILFVLSGLLIWSLFSSIFFQASTSLVQNQDLIKKMDFPKIILPISKIVFALIDCVVTFLILFIFIVFFKIEFSYKMLLGPFILIPILLFSLGISFILIALTIKNRDLQHVVPFLVNFGVWFSPVFYPVSILPDRYMNYIFINPIAACIQLFRWSFFGEPINSFVFIGIYIGVLVFLIGFFSFKKIEDKIIEYL